MVCNTSEFSGVMRTSLRHVPLSSTTVMSTFRRTFVEYAVSPWRLTTVSCVDPKPPSAFRWPASHLAVRDAPSRSPWCSRASIA